METPSSTTRRVTRSQALTSAFNSNLNNNIPISKKLEDSEKGVTKSRPRTCVALADITNDSPIVGVAMGKLETPLSAMSKKKMNTQIKQTFTPGSGESLLRGQAKTLLQKVNEESDNKQFLKPLDAETKDCLAVQEELMLPEEEGSESDKNVITRSLLFDFSEKSEGSDSVCSSVLTNESTVKTDDESSSVWSLQVNTSGGDDFEEIEEFEDGVDEDEVSEYGYEEVEVDDLDELCEGISKISVNGAKFEGKHTRFVYNSDDEIEAQEECDKENKNESSPNVVKLKGLPTPKGKHLRFSVDN